MGGAKTQAPLTPLELHDGIWLKREDKFIVAGCSGGKARTAWHIATKGPTLGLITAGSRHSPQINIVAHIAKKLGMPCRAHTSTGEKGLEVLEAEKLGAQIIQHKPGYNSVIIARAKADRLLTLGWTYIPFGMECEEAIVQTMQQVRGFIEAPIKRIVIPVGSGMSLAGVLWGLKTYEIRIPVIGVCVGADPIKRLMKWAPDGWRKMVTLVKAQVPYNAHLENVRVGKVLLDSVYEAKCKAFLQAGDCLWIVGIRRAK